METTYLKLIVESDFNDYKTIITENSETGVKKIKLVGPYIIADKNNNNKRRYIYDELKPEVERFIKEIVECNRALGELEHPKYAHINPERAAIKIESLVLNESEKTWIGESVVLATDTKNNIKGTPMGDILASLVQYGTKLGFSTRGVGTIEDAIVKNYRITTVDCVTNPSIGEFVEGILESKSFIVNTHGMILEANYNEFEESLKKLQRKNKAEQLKKIVGVFVSKL
jgi:hypothetical protein